MKYSFIKPIFFFILIFLMHAFGHVFATSPVLKPDDVHISNYSEGNDDEIIVKNLQKDDVIRVYANQSYEKNLFLMQKDFQKITTGDPTLSRYFENFKNEKNGYSLKSKLAWANIRGDFPLTGGLQYTISMTINQLGYWGTAGFELRQCDNSHSYFTPNRVAITTKTSERVSLTFTLPSDVSCSRLILFPNYSNNLLDVDAHAEFNDIQLELGSVATIYEKSALSEKTAHPIKNLFHSQYFNRNMKHTIENDSLNSYKTEGSGYDFSGNYELTSSITQGAKYTLSGYVTVYPDDTSDNKKISLNFQYTDDTYTHCIESLTNNGVERFVSITCEPQSGKVIKRIYGWIFDYSNHAPNIHRSIRNVQLEIGNTPTAFEEFRYIARIMIPQLGKSAGNVKILLRRMINQVQTDSPFLNKTFEAEKPTNGLKLSQVKVFNHAGKPDEVKVTGLNPGDVIKLYYENNQNLLGKEKDIELSFTKQCGTHDFDTSLRKNGNGSFRLLNSTVTCSYLYKNVNVPLDKAKQYLFGGWYYIQTAGSIGPFLGIRDYNVLSAGRYSADVAYYVNKWTSMIGKIPKNNTVSTTNGFSFLIGIGDKGANPSTIYVDSPFLFEVPYDTISSVVYDEKTNSIGAFVGTAQADSSGIATITVSNLNPSAGYLKLTNTSGFSNESKPLRLVIPFELKSKTLLSSQVSVHNAVGAEDSIFIKKIPKNSSVNIMDANKATLKTVNAINQSEIKIAMDTINLNSHSKLLVTMTESEKSESNPLTVTISPEKQTPSISTSHVSILNHKNKSDQITINGLKLSDKISIYRNKHDETALASQEVLGSTVQISLELEAAAGKVFISKTSSGKKESARIAVSYLAEK